MKRDERLRLLPALVVLLSSVVGVSACSTSASSASPVISWAPTKDADIPAPTTEARSSGVPVLATAAWGGPGQLRIVTWGSSGCPELPDSVSGTAHTITVKTKALNPSGGGCTGDAAAATSVVAEPTNVDSESPVTVLIGTTKVTLAAR